MLKKTIKQTVILQAVILIYTMATVSAKFASGYHFMSPGFIFFYGLEILILGVYAICWQQVIKRYDLSVAYANRAFGIFWSLIWAILFFNEQVTWKNAAGIAVIVIGVYMVNTDGDK